MKHPLPSLLLMSLLVVACNKSGGSSTPRTSQPTTSSDQVTTSPDAPASPLAPKPVVPSPVVVKPNPTAPGPVVPSPVSNVPDLALTFDTNITQVNFTAAQAAKYNKAIAIVKLVVATEEFKNKVLNYTYNGQQIFADNAGKTNAQIYQSILDAAEELHPVKNNTMDLEVELYYEASSIVGYTNGGTTRIWVNTKFFDSFQENSVAGNLFHEWLHKLGYVHDFASTAKRPYSVPYAVGYIMGDIGKKFL